MSCTAIISSAICISSVAVAPGFSLRHCLDIGLYGGHGGRVKQQLMIRVPTAYALIIQPGVKIRIDEHEVIELEYSICFPSSCQVQMELTQELYQKMRAGKQMVVSAMNIQKKTMGFPVPLTGFSKAYDDPPVDREKYEEQRRQLMEAFKKNGISQTADQGRDSMAPLSTSDFEDLDLEDLGDLGTLD